jgi:parvulin-like peptidyl-prolyl isomerase
VTRVLPLLALFALGACSSPAESPDRAPAPATSTAARAEAPAPDAAPPPVDAPPDAPPAADERTPVAPVPAQLPAIVARVDGTEISRVQFEETIRGIEFSVGSDVPPEERDRVYRDVLDDLILQRVLLLEAQRRVTVSDTEVNAYIRELRTQFPDEATFRRMLQEEGLTLDALREQLRIEMAVEQLIDEAIGDRVRPTREEVAEYYRENRAQFRHARVRASQILFTVPPYADSAARLRARQQAEHIFVQLRGGADFAALARQHSQDQGSAARGGDLGYFEWGEMVEPLNEAVFRLEPNAEIEVVESAQGVHILMVTDRQPTDRVAPLEEVRGTIEEMLESINRQRELEAFVQGLRERARIQIYF